MSICEFILFSSFGSLTLTIIKKKHKKIALPTQFLRKSKAIFIFNFYIAPTTARIAIAIR